jgi:hypothetical protein
MNEIRDKEIIAKRAAAAAVVVNTPGAWLPQPVVIGRQKRKR